MGVLLEYGPLEGKYRKLLPQVRGRDFAERCSGCKWFMREHLCVGTFNAWLLTSVVCIMTTVPCRCPMLVGWHTATPIRCLFVA